MSTPVTNMPNSSSKNKGLMIGGFVAVIIIVLGLIIGFVVRDIISKRSASLTSSVPPPQTPPVIPSGVTQIPIVPVVPVVLTVPKKETVPAPTIEPTKSPSASTSEPTTIFTGIQPVLIAPVAPVVPKTIPEKIADAITTTFTTFTGIQPVLIAPTAPVPVDPRTQAFNSAKANIQPYVAPTQSFGYAVQAIKRKGPDYTLASFNNPEFDKLATSTDGVLGSKFVGFIPGMYLIGGMAGPTGEKISGEYMYCRVVGTGTSTDPRRIACGTPTDPLKFDTKAIDTSRGSKPLDLGYPGTSFFGTMYGATKTVNAAVTDAVGSSNMANKTTLCRNVGDDPNVGIACFGLDGNNKIIPSGQFDSYKQTPPPTQIIRPKTDGLP